MVPLLMLKQLKMLGGMILALQQTMPSKVIDESIQYNCARQVAAITQEIIEMLLVLAP